MNIYLSNFSFLLLIFSLNSFSADFLYHITASTCYGNTVDTTLSDSFYLSFENNTINLSGRTVFNCGGDHFILQSFKSDTIYLQRRDTGRLLRCECLYEFGISIPSCSLNSYRVLLWDEGDDIPTLDTLLTSHVHAEADRIKFALTPLLECNPNPFSPQTTITFSGTQDRESVKLNIIDPTGRVVRSMSGSANGGKVSYVWDGTDKNGKALARGVYVANVVGKGVNLKKLLVLTK